MNISPATPRIEPAEVPLERLAGNAALSEEQKVLEAARQFEAMLVRQILASSNQSVIRSSFSNDSAASGIYRDMINNQLADSVSRSGSVGMAQMLAREFTRQNCAAPKPGAANDNAAAAASQPIPSAHLAEPAAGAGTSKQAVENLSSRRAFFEGSATPVQRLKRFLTPQTSPSQTQF